jgi:SMI1 / KNR4 family (SUKH-1)
VDETDWSALLNTMRVEDKLFPATQDQLDVFERQTGVGLPVSYRTFCTVFGPGSLGDWYEFAVPGYTGYQPDKWDLATKNAQIRSMTDWEEMVEDVEQFRRGVIFGGDQATGTFLFDPAIVTHPKSCEYAVYAVWRDWTTERVCDTFAEFVALCLHRGNRTLYDEPAKLTYGGPWQGRAAWEKRKRR